jgi:hypothetical protein
VVGVFEDEGKHYYGEFLGVFVERALGGQAHVDGAHDVLFEHFGRGAELVVGEDGDFYGAVGPLFDVFGKHLGGCVTGVTGRSVVAELHGNGFDFLLGGCLRCFCPVVTPPCPS